ncbi:hypothetical protein LTR56_012588 [Elasticomyces elasticus]|nr:hypothetical protein LTR22_018463 [Elasticomyces elasticus]KAK3639228.1 hypothetical protein LTR56_012588 [Elasticomyces elasticus]KAK4912532.1 hypothetical protein LTR49_018999 [Elasticomyces elasticus]KAK5751926.1 hypothetical protein LTS12_018032 [Elasticomyces elasticus]
MANNTTSEPAHVTQLDHVIVLLPYDDIVNPPTWVTDNFTVSPGGRHADNKTENRLILFADGTYVELIAFIDDDPEKRKGHWWDKPFGIVDFALTNKSFNYPALQERLKASRSGVSYAEPIAGGRTMPDGQELKWKVTFPLGAERGEVPFWCHDVTPRDQRVPVSKENTRHPCGATGMFSVVVHEQQDSLKRIGSALSAITATESQATGELTEKSPRYEVGTPNGRRDDAFVELQSIEQGDKQHDLRLILRLPHDAAGSPDGISQHIGNGVVHIGFAK